MQSEQPLAAIHSFISFRFVSFRFISFRLFSFSCSFQFVSCHVMSFHFVSFVPSFMRSWLFPAEFRALVALPGNVPSASFLSFQLLPSTHYFFPFVSSLPFHSLLSSFRFNSYIPFVTASLCFKSFVKLKLSAAARESSN